MNKWLKLLDLLGILGSLVGSISSELRKSLVKGLQEAKIEAAKTENKMDDIIIGFLCALFDVPEVGE